MTPARSETAEAMPWWLFTVDCPAAERVMLVCDEADGASAWLPMKRSAPQGLWELEMPGPGRFDQVRYYTVQGNTVIRGGTAGLSATRLKKPDTKPDTPRGLSAAVVG